MKALHYSWVICGSCVLLIFCTLGLTVGAFSAYLPYITEFGQLSKTQSSMLITIRSLFSFLSMLLINRFYQHTGIRYGLCAAIAATALSFCAYSFAKSFLGYCLASVIMGISHGLGGMYPISILMHKWFYSHQGLALGLCSAGSGIATIVVPPLVTLLVEATSLKATFQIEAVFIVFVAIAVFYIVRNTPEELGMTPLKSPKSDRSDAAVRRSRTATVGKAPMACMIASALLLGMACNGTLMNLTMLYTTEGFDRLAVSFLVSLCGISQTVGKCVYGYISDWLGARKSGSISFCALFSGIGLTCLAGISGYPMALCAMLLIGCGFPLYSVGLSVYARDISSAEDYPIVLKHLQITIILGGLMVSVVPGILCDLTGSYVPAYILFALCALLSLALVRLSYRFQDAKQ